MGQEFSCPCEFTREEQTRKLMISKHDNAWLQSQRTATEGTELDLSPKKPKKFSRLQHILDRGEQLLKKYTSRTPSASTPSLFGFQDDSRISNDVQVVVVCEPIDNFEEFLGKYNALYNNVKLHLA